MKKLLLSLIAYSTVFASEPSYHKIVPYADCHKDAVLKIVFEDVLKFFSGSAVVTDGLMTEDQFIAENKKVMEAILANPLNLKLVLLAENNEIVGFIEIAKMREPSLESMSKLMAAQGLPACDEQQLAAIMPQIKKIDADCKEYALIESLAVTKKWRGKGFGKTLLKETQEKIKQRWPSLDQMRLTVNESNAVARQLYESQGFVRNTDELPHLSIMKIVEYIKSL